MTIKNKLIELAIESLSGGDAPAEMRGKYHPAVIELYLDMAFSDILQEEFQNAGSDFTIFDSFAKPYKCIVKKDDDREQKYFDLPVTLIPLRPKQAAIRSISLYNGERLAFAPIQNASMPMWDELEAMKIDDTCSYSIEGSRVEFFMNAPLTGAEILVKMITPFADLLDNDDVFVPGGKNAMLFQRMYQFMSLRGNSKDEINDNNPFQTK